ncbi:TPA: NUDIX domain-containing protein [Vibrio parahaemolyticus]|uniref:NUDIX domain-containing protein n=1 Tax=Vibrio parahaemolyticus TaxID=670 RepID=UPI00063EA271|nr:NUDIX domain-containing protein [Vibrio parahaemolyticus]KLI83196.1 NUDIX hydrolase [Vibrio parahaemolyticus]HAS6550736.1 NUDIX domain-containing protein [Vibrio parahaemolyticus]HAS6736443.1 NUDIX domain-containing protein [Vibrio parahaemolyticus]HAS6849099.1 NUDIX domain-containing protein [Vibrio parahaemolyticus]HCE3689817.1 NUDIX domain-containing protein [Vibrio parahaemolyticus]
MSASDYIKEVRSKIGTMPLLIPGVAAVILNESKELLLQQKLDGTWSLPAGMIEPQESPVQALIREVREETGLAVKVERLLGVFGGEGFGFTYPNGDQVEYTVIMFKCVVESNSKSATDDETVCLEWFSKGNMPKLELPYPIECLFAENGAAYFSG